MCAAKLPASPERRGEAMSSGHRGRGREGKSVGSVISLYRDSKRNVHFLGMFALLSTCDRPAVDPRKTPEEIEEREILIIGHFFLGGRIWRSKTEPVNQ